MNVQGVGDLSRHDGLHDDGLIQEAEPSRCREAFDVLHELHGCKEQAAPFPLMAGPVRDAGEVLAGGGSRPDNDGLAVRVCLADEVDHRLGVFLGDIASL